MKELLDRQLQEEKKNSYIAAGVTAGVMIILLLFSMIWNAVMGRIPAIDEPVWKTVGFMADFGNNVEGSKKVNNFEKPSETPSEHPKSPPKAETNNTAPSQGNTSPNHESNTSSNQTVNTSETPSNNTSTSNSNNTSNSNQTSTTSTNNTNNANTPPGGSNHGNGSQTGNAGNPNAQVLNPDGNFEFGTGIGGAGGRMPLKTDLKGYNVQLEEKIKFDIVIAPSGDVVYCKASYAINPELAAIGKDNIMKWKFSETDPSAGNLKTYVVVTFKLK